MPVFAGELFLNYYQPIILSEHLKHLRRVHLHWKTTHSIKSKRYIPLLTALLPLSSLLSSGEIALRGTLRQVCNGALMGYALLKTAWKISLCFIGLFIIVPPLWCRPKWGEWLLQKMQLIGPQQPHGIDISPQSSHILASQIKKCSSVLRSMIFPYILVCGAAEFAIKGTYYTALQLTKTAHALALDATVISRCALSAISLAPIALHNPEIAFRHAAAGQLNLFAHNPQTF